MNPNKTVSVDKGERVIINLRLWRRSAWRMNAAIATQKHSSSGTQIALYICKKFPSGISRVWFSIYANQPQIFFADASLLKALHF